MKHKHNWTIYYQKTILMSNHNYEECSCGKLQDYLETGDIKEFYTKTKKETMLKLKEKVKNWDKPVPDFVKTNYFWERTKR